MSICRAPQLQAALPRPWRVTAGRRQEVKAAETNRLHPQAALGSCILLCKRGALQTTRQPAHLDWSSAARSAAETLLLQYLWSSRCRGRYWREGSLAPAAGAPLAPRCVSAVQGAVLSPSPLP